MQSASAQVLVTSNRCQHCVMYHDEEDWPRLSIHCDMQRNLVEVSNVRKSIVKYIEPQEKLGPQVPGLWSAGPLSIYLPIQYGSAQPPCRSTVYILTHTVLQP